MTPIPCYRGTCSIDMSTSIDPSDAGALVVELRAADTGSIGCVDRDDDETDGVYVQVSGLAADGTSGLAPGSVPCGQSLGRLTDGALFAYPEGALAFDYAGLGETAPFGDDTDYNGHLEHSPVEVRSHDVLIENPFDCPCWVHYTVPEMKVMGSRRPDTGGSAPAHPNHSGGESFYVTGYFNLATVALPATAGAVAAVDLYNSYNNRFDVHGSWSGEGNSPGHQLGHPMHCLFRLGAGEHTTIRNRIVLISQHHFAMSGDDGDGAVAVLHPAAVMWREDARP